MLGPKRKYFQTPTDKNSSEQLRKLEKIKPFGHSKAPKKKKIGQILLIFPVLGKTTHMYPGARKKIWATFFLFYPLKRLFFLEGVTFPGIRCHFQEFGVNTLFQKKNLSPNPSGHGLFAKNCIKIGLVWPQQLHF